MSILDILLNISPALEQGKALENAETWSNVQNANHALIVILGFGLLIAKQAGYDLPITDDQIAELAGGIAGVGAVISNFLHHTTNPNSGIKRSSK